MCGLPVGPRKFSGRKYFLSVAAGACVDVDGSETTSGEGGGKEACSLKIIARRRSISITTSTKSIKPTAKRTRRRTMNRM